MLRESCCLLDKMQSLRTFAIVINCSIYEGMSASKKCAVFVRMGKSNLEIEHFTSEVRHAYLKDHPRTAFPSDKVTLDFFRIANANVVPFFEKVHRTSYYKFKDRFLSI